jgi:hypothetical protein
MRRNFSHFNLSLPLSVCMIHNLTPHMKFNNNNSHITRSKSHIEANFSVPNCARKNGKVYRGRHSGKERANFFSCVLCINNIMMMMIIIMLMMAVQACMMLFIFYEKKNFKSRILFFYQVKNFSTRSLYRIKNCHWHANYLHSTFFSSDDIKRLLMRVEVELDSNKRLFHYFQLNLHLF